MKNKILNYWLNGRSVQWISNRTKLSTDEVVTIIRGAWL